MVFLNNGSGALGGFFAPNPAAVFTGGSNSISPTSSLALGDVDGDGRADLAILRPPTSNPGGISVMVFLNNGSGALGGFFAPNPAAVFTGGSNSISPTSSLALGDVDGNGRADLGILRPPSSNPGGISVLVFLNSGAGALGGFFAPNPAAVFTGGSNSISPTSSFALGDVNGDGRADLGILRPPASNPGGINVMVFLNSGGGALGGFFAPNPATVFTGGSNSISPTSSLDLGDVDADDQADLAILRPPSSNPGGINLFVFLNTSP